MPATYEGRSLFFVFGVWCLVFGELRFLAFVKFQVKDLDTATIFYSPTSKAQNIFLSPLLKPKVSTPKH